MRRWKKQPLVEITSNFITKKCKVKSTNRYQHPARTTETNINSLLHMCSPGPLHSARAAPPLPRMRCRVLRPMFSLRGARATSESATTRTCVSTLPWQHYCPLGDTSRHIKCQTDDSSVPLKVVSFLPKSWPLTYWSLAHLASNCSSNFRW